MIGYIKMEIKMKNNLLFKPIQIRNMTLPNRIIVSPMCQYSAFEGKLNDWHFQHLAQFGFSGAALIMVESSAVESIGRITHNCVGIYNKDNIEALKKTIQKVKKFSLPNTKFGIQIGHAGRKASTQRPWEGRSSLKESESPWQTIAPSAIPFEKNWHVPKPMDMGDLSRVKKAFVDAAIASIKIGFDIIEIHAAHGYLLHQFLSPFSNKRDDQYGGNLANRMRFPLEIISEIKKISGQTPVGVRITGTEWEKNGINIREAITFCKELEILECDYVCVSSGGNTLNPSIPIKEHYQVHLSAEIKKKTNILTRTVGMIKNPTKANKILIESKADMIAMARSFLSNPRWVWDAADLMGVNLLIPDQYVRRFKKSN